jgi:hypothetical protein
MSPRAAAVAGRVGLARVLDPAVSVEPALGARGGRVPSATGGFPHFASRSFRICSAFSSESPAPSSPDGSWRYPVGAAPATSVEPRLEALVDHTEVLVDRVVSCHRRVSRFVHVEHVKDVVIFEEL